MCFTFYSCFAHVYLLIFQFVGLVRQVTDGDFEVIKLLQKRFNKASVHYVASDDFRRTLNVTREKIENDSVSKYVHIRELAVELKAFEEKPVAEEKPVKVRIETQRSDRDESDGPSTSHAFQKEKWREPVRAFKHFLICLINV